MQANDLLSFFSALCLILFLIGDQSKSDLKNHYMINEIRINALVSGLRTGMYYIDDDVLLAMASVPRHHFFDWQNYNRVYHNVALPLDGKDYIIPEPFVTAMMFHLMSIKPTDKVLEVGFGTGYETAVLSRMAHNVHSVKPDEPLRKRLNRFAPVEQRGFNNVSSKQANNIMDWTTEGPFDAILVKQSMTIVPKSLLKQLKPGGRLVIPIGPTHDAQLLTVYTKQENGKITTLPTLLLSIPPLLQGKEI